MAKSILSTVAAAALICSYTSADDTDSAQTLLRKSRNLEENGEVIAANPDPLAVCEQIQMMKAQGMEHELQNALQRNTTTVNISSKNIASQAQNPGTITLKAGGGMTISGYVKLPADIEVLPNGAGITLEPEAVLDNDGHSITGPGSNVEGITLNEDGGMTISGNV